MNKHLLLFTFFFVCLLQVSFSKNILFVKQGAEGIGSSWANATGDLQYALAKAKAGSEIWIAEGVYHPTQCAPCTEQDRSVSFVIPDGVKVYGGFKGDEKRISQRKWKKHPTHLSGNIGQPGPFDNSYTVVLTRSVSDATLLDGLVIADGYADATKPAGHPFRSGGGLYNDAPGKDGRSRPTIHNCLFLNNFAFEGGGLFNNGDQGDASPELVDCTFTSNRAVYGGGAIFNNGEHGTSNPSITYSQFVDNVAAYGPGIFSTFSQNDADPSLVNCAFVNNKAQHGGCIYLLGLSESPKLRTVTFVNNYSHDTTENVTTMDARAVPVDLMAEMPLDDEEL